MGTERRAAPLGQPIVPFTVTILQASAKPLPLFGAVIRHNDQGRCAKRGLSLTTRRWAGSIAKNRARRYSAVALVVEAGERN